jgi:hypothetical protein
MRKYLMSQRRLPERRIEPYLIKGSLTKVTKINHIWLLFVAFVKYLFLYLLMQKHQPSKLVFLFELISNVISLTYV